MISSRIADNPRVRVDLIDADGCVYNSHYQYLLFSLLSNFSELLSTTPANKITSEQIDAMIQHIHSVEVEYAHVASSREKHNQRIHELRDAVSLHKSKIEKYMLRADVSFDGSIDVSKSFTREDQKYFFHFVQHCIEKLNEADPRVLQEMFLAANADLIADLTSEDDCDVQVLMVGSARQDHHHDKLGMNLRLTNSIYTDLDFLARHLQKQLSGTREVSLNRAVLADIYGGLELGKSYDNIMASTHRTQHAKSIYDLTKFTILYMAAHANPNAVTVNFYDDNRTIRDSLLRAFLRCPELLPAGMQLNILSYDGKLYQHGSVMGQGMHDSQYRNTIRQICNLALIEKNGVDRSMIDPANTINLRQLAESLGTRSDESNLAVLLDADGCFYNNFYTVLMLEVINKFHAEIDEALKHNPFAAKPEELKRKIREFVHDYDILKIDPQKDLKRLATYLDLRKINKADMVSKLDYLCPDIIDSALYRANAHMFNGLVSRAKELNCRRITFMVGSNRQSYKIDGLNSDLHGTRSFYRDLQRMVELLPTIIKTNISFHLDKFLLADAYANLPSGTSFCRSLQIDSKSISHADTVWEEMKTHSIYGFMHYIAQRYPNTMGVEFIDDREDILKAIAEAYGTDDKYGALPAYMPLRMGLYSGDVVVRKPDYMLEGRGLVDLELDKTLRMIAKSFGVRSVSAAASEGKCIKVEKFADFYGMFIEARGKYKIETVVREMPQVEASKLKLSSSGSDLELFSLFAPNNNDFEPATVESQESKGLRSYLPNAPGFMKGWF